MRITNSMMVNSTIYNLNNNLNELDKTYEKLATGKEFSKPSDDPIAATASMKIESDLSEVEQYQRNVDDGLSYSQVTESAVMEVEDILQRTRELTVQAANGTNSAEDTEKIANELEQLREQLIQVGNTTYMDEYIFSGNNTDQPLFDDNGEYNVDMTSEFVDGRDAKTYQVGSGTEIEAGVNGLDIFGYEQLDGAAYIGTGENQGDPAVVGPGGTFKDTDIANGDFDNMEIYVEYDGERKKIQLGTITDAANDGYVDDLEKAINDELEKAFPKTPGPGSEVTASITTPEPYSIKIQTAGGSVEKLKVDVVQATESSLISDMDKLIEAMNTGDTDAIQQGITDIDKHIDSTLAALADIGATSRGMELTKSRLDENYSTLSELYSKTTEIDYAEVTMEMQMQENVYQASLSVGAMVIQPTLVDFIS